MILLSTVLKWKLLQKVSEQVEMSVIGSKSPVLFIDDLGLEILTVFNV